MIMDKLLEFADADTGVAAAAGTVLLDNQIDLGLPARDPGNGQPVYLVITIDTSLITAGTAGTIQFALVSDDVAAIHATTRTVHLLTPEYVTDDIALAQALAGKVLFCGAVPTEGQRPYEQFLGVQAIIGGQTITAGAVSAFLTLDPTGWKPYPNGI